MIRSVLAIGLGLTCGCSSAPERRALTVHPYGQDDPTWQPCPDEWGGKAIECLRTEVPLDESSTTETSVVLLRRLRAPGDSGGQLWALDGGPGFAGDSFFAPSFVEIVHSAQLDLYVPSHRGTRDDSRLDCEEQKSESSPEGARIAESEWGACAESLREEWGEALSSFSATGAARDVAYQMQLAPLDGRRLVFGGSYGTLWAQRLLSTNAPKIDGVWLDSIVDLEGTLERVDAHAHAAVTRLLELCANEATCAERFDGTPLDVATDVIAAYDNGEGCGQRSRGLTRQGLQIWAHGMLLSDPASWVVLTAGFARASRCTPEDELALEAAIARATADTPVESGGPDTGYYTPELNRHILYRELFQFDVTEEERANFDRTAFAQSGSFSALAEEAAGFGPTYRDPDPIGEVTTTAPILLLSGQLDPLDPPEWATSTAARFEGAQLISVPWAGHSVLRYLGLSDDGCGRQLIGDFLSGESIDPQCAEDTPPPDFRASNQTVRAKAKDWFGQDLF